MKRKSMNPVMLLRFIEFLQIIARNIDKGKYNIPLKLFPSELSMLTGSFYLSSISLNRVRSVLREISVCELCQLRGEEVIIDSNCMVKWDVFSKTMEFDLLNNSERWNNTNDFLSTNHDLYKTFNLIACESLHDEDKNFMYSVKNKFKSIPTRSTLVEWGILLNKIQQNYTNEDDIYPTHRNFECTEKHLQTFKDALISIYLQMIKETENPNISLPYLAEKVCSELKIKRSDFRNLMEELYLQHTHEIWLGSGNIQSYAYERFKIEKQNILDVFGNGLWFLRTYLYNKIDLPQYVVKGIPRRFIKIKNIHLDV